MRFRISPVRYLGNPAGKDDKILFVRMNRETRDVILVSSKLDAGYGRIFPMDSVITRGRNGTVWEEKDSFVYLRFNKRF